jgi:hypothetical protein
MAAQVAMPYPLRKMFEYLDLDKTRGFQTVPLMMEEAMVACRMCKLFDNCDDLVESRYFQCPNRDLLDRLERLQGKI